MRLIILIAMLLSPIISDAEEIKSEGLPNNIVVHNDFIKLQFLKHHNLKDGTPELTIQYISTENTVRDAGTIINQELKHFYTEIDQLIKSTPLIELKPFSGTSVIRASLFSKEIELRFYKEMTPVTNEDKEWLEKSNSLYKSIFELISIMATPNKARNEMDGSDEPPIR